MPPRFSLAFRLGVTQPAWAAIISPAATIITFSYTSHCATETRGFLLFIIHARSVQFELAITNAFPSRCTVLRGSDRELSRGQRMRMRKPRPFPNAMPITGCCFPVSVILPSLTLPRVVVINPRPRRCAVYLRAPPHPHDLAFALSGQSPPHLVHFRHVGFCHTILHPHTHSSCRSFVNNESPGWCSPCLTPHSMQNRLSVTYLQPGGGSARVDAPLPPPRPCGSGTLSPLSLTRIVCGCSASKCAGPLTRKQA
ncbi:hypothetical protein VUR80DRAFT_7212 [Thermomyces stellatus]